MSLLLCGAASIDITPRNHVPGIYLAGFESDRKATAILDPLEAGCLYLTDGTHHVALVTLDVIGFHHTWLTLVRDRLSGRFPDPQGVLVASTHTHQGPDTMGLWGKALLGRVPIRSGLVPAYQEALVGAIVQVVLDAARNPVPVSVRAARFDVPADWTRNDRKGGGKDDFGQALAFDGPGGRVATVCNFACHPETLWEGNTLVSADYPGAFRRRIRATTPGVPLFFQGALGGMVTPNVPVKAGLEERKPWIDRLGAGLAERVAGALDGAAPLPDTTLSLRRAPLELPLENNGFRLMRWLGVMDREFLLGRIRSEMNLVTVGPDVALLTAPGECTPEVGRELVRRMPGTHRLLLCLGCDELGYVLTPDQFRNKEWHYEQSMSVGPRTSPMLWATADRLAQP